MTLEPDDYHALATAVDRLENPGLAAQIANLVGQPIDLLLKNLPAPVTRAVSENAERALKAAMKVAVRTMSTDSMKTTPSSFIHQTAAGASGALGGVFGLPALAIELPISTTIILRSILDIARSEGENVRDVETEMAALEVFAFGSRSKSDDALDTSYYATRSALAGAMSDAGRYIIANGLKDPAAPALVRFISLIAKRFGEGVVEKVAAASVPVIGAAGGAIINVVFVNHFQELARGHFTVRRLERKYGAEVIREEYERIKNS